MVAEAGPSTPSGFFPAPFRVSEYRRSSTPYRSSTPAACSSPGPGYLPPRFRSSSVVSRSGEDETLRSQRFESVQRLKSTWELLAEKYGSVELEDDDEVDILSGRVVRDRGRLRSLDRREFGEISENEQEVDTETEVSVTGDGGSKRGDGDEEDEEDQDELGEWGERSGLDMQTPAPEERPPEPRWTEEDEADLESFLREEAKRRTAIPGEGLSGRRSSGEPGSEAGWESEEDQSDRDIPFVISPRRHGTRVYNELEDLFPEDENVSEVSAEESEDELLEVDEEATRKTPAPRSPSNATRSGHPYDPYATFNGVAQNSCRTSPTSLDRRQRCSAETAALSTLSPNIAYSRTHRRPAFTEISLPNPSAPACRIPVSYTASPAGSLCVPVQAFTCSRACSPQSSPIFPTSSGLISHARTPSP
ncbi:hypothetical protein JCM24511_05065 [Saitozyma sp. JCM 24511]|nr:hypothetical protein JCM24511_05065 [Saitozyma sp. JCM 24511]